MKFFNRSYNSKRFPKHIKFLLKGLGCFLFLGLLASCTDNSIGEPDETPWDESTDTFKITFRYHLPEGVSSRSGTESGGGSEGGTEEGTVNENAINATIYFSIEDDNSLLQNPKFNFEEKNGRLEAEADPKDLIPLFGQKVKMFLVSNAGGVDLTSVSQTFSYQTLDFAQGGTTVEDTDHKQNGKKVPIANKSMFIIDFNFKDNYTFSGSTSGEALAALKNLPNDAFTENGTNRHLDLSKLAVEKSGNDWVSAEEKKMQLERLVSRVDFKPNHGKDSEKNDLDDNIYQIGTIDNLYAKMTSLQIFNVAKDAYIFRHTSKGNKDAAGENNEVIFGIENNNENFGKKPEVPDEGDMTDYDSYTWMADMDWDNKNRFYTASLGPSAWYGPTTGNPDSQKYDYFYNQPVKKDGVPIYVIEEKNTTNGNEPEISIESLLKRTESETTSTGKYYPWCYITENTLPSTAAMINGLSTGIAFKMILCKKDGTPLQPNDDNFYSGTKSDYDAEMQGLVNEKESTNDVNKKTAIENQIQSLKKKVVGKLEPAEEEYDSKFFKLTIGSQEVYAEKVKLDEEGNEGYAVTYYYFFRHNISKTHTLGEVEPMQFAVVRNNIYKVSVTALNGLPEPYEPNRPDEPQENVIAVELQILSWARADIEVVL